MQWLHGYESWKTPAADSELQRVLGMTRVVELSRPGPLIHTHRRTRDGVMVALGHNESNRAPLHNSTTDVALTV